MEFTDKYTTADLITEGGEKEAKKIIVSQDAYAVSEMIQILIKKLEHIRVDLIR